MNYSTRNITRCYRLATAEQVASGLAWYADAHELAATLDPQCPDRAAGVLAALSPQTSWTQNVRMATLAYHDRPALRGLGRSLAQADAILAGAAPLAVLGGPKTRSFYANIVGDLDQVTVDRHAFDLAVGRVASDRERGAVLARQGGYAEVAQAYRRAAKRLAVAPAQAQAVTWLAWRAGAVKAAANRQARSLAVRSRTALAAA